MSQSAEIAQHEQFTDDTGTWCYASCPRPEEECGRLAVEQNDPPGGEQP